MTDKERLDLIERVYREMRHYRTLVNYYTRKNLRVSYLRAREKGETEQVLSFTGRTNAIGKPLKRYRLYGIAIPIFRQPARYPAPAV